MCILFVAFVLWKSIWLDKFDMTLPKGKYILDLPLVKNKE